MVRLFDGGSGTPFANAIIDLILSKPEGEDVLSGFELVKSLAEGFDGPVIAFANTNGGADSGKKRRLVGQHVHQITGADRGITADHQG